MTNPNRGKIQSIYKAFDIVEQLEQEGPQTVTDVAERLNVSRSTAHAYLSTLEDLELVVLGERGYELSLRFLETGIKIRDELPIVEVGHPIIKQLSQDTREATWLVVEQHGRAVYVDLALGERAVHTQGRVGKRTPIHCLAAGKAILAHLSRERVEQIVSEHGLEKRTEHTIGTRSELFEALDRVLERGYALNDHESISGARAISAPVVVDGVVRGAISVSGPANRVTMERLEEEIVGEVLAAANELELKLESQGVTRL